ncbi:MAG: restriction endonuclease subunit S [Fuerstiella sp.]|nr:restriction endonuclease subunit S [Fuerstiella sp.]
MSESWEIKTLEELCEFRNGLWKGKKPPFVEVGIIRNTNFTKNGFLDDSDIAYHDVEVKQFEKRRLEYGDLILEKSGGGPKQPVGRVIPFEINEGDFSFSNFTSVIRIKDKAELDFQFLHRCLLYYYVSGVTETMQRRSTGIRNLDFKTYKQLQIPIPEVAEQKRIVSILDEAFGAIDRAKRVAEINLSNAIELFDSYLNRVFTEKGEGWEETTLGTVANFKNGLNYDRNSNGQTLPVVGVGDFQTNSYVPIDSLGTAMIDGTLDAKYELQKNDILTVRSNGSKDLIGRCMLVPDLNEVTSYSGFVIRIRSNQDRIAPRFLLQLLKSRGTVYLLTRDGGGANINNINQGNLSALPLSFPTDIDEQNRSADVIDQISQEAEALKRCSQRKSTALDELKQSILQKTFTAQLTAKSPELEAVP